MATAAIVRLVHNQFERLYDSLVARERSERTILFLLCGYAALWTAYAVVAASSRDIHFDMGELMAWSREIDLGTPKHPPLAAWLVGAWFSVFPREDWAYHLIAVVMATLSLWIAWRASTRYLSLEKRAVGIMLLTFVPFYNFHALKFNVNAVMTPCWAMTTWCFLQSLETKRAGWAVLTGISAAAALLGKYWSVFLLAGLGVAALFDVRRAAYLRSLTPWLTIAVASVLVAPHIVWIIAHDFQSLRYPFIVHNTTFFTAVISSLTFITGTFAYIALPIVFVLLATRPNFSAMRDTIWPTEPIRRTIVVIFVAPLFLAATIAVPLRVVIVSLWSMPAMTMLPIVLLSSPLVTIKREASVRLLALAVSFPLLMVAVSPGVAIAFHRIGPKDYANHYRLIAQAVEHAWHQRTGEPLRIVGSYADLVNGMVFYFSDQPSTFDILNPQETPWVDEDRLNRQGIAIVCPVTVADCVRSMDEFVARFQGAETEEVVLARRYLGILGPPVRYRIAVILPQPHLQAAATGFLKNKLL